MLKNYHFKILDSTSRYLKKNYKEYDNMSFVSTDYQTDGHGRNNKKWFSNDGENLLFSILIKDKDLIKKYSSISLASSCCIYKVLNDLNIKNVSIKWPNDVYVNDKKISGILLEGISFYNEIEAIIIGIGINVNISRFDEEIKDIATSIKLETKQEFDIEELKNKVYNEFVLMFDSLKCNDNSYLAIVRENNYLKNRKVFINKELNKVLVEVVDINDDNSLKVKEEDKIYDVYTGEISFIK